MVTLTFYKFDCPNGHLLLLDKAQTEGEVRVRCDVDGCDFNEFITLDNLEEVNVPRWSYY